MRQNNQRSKQTILYELGQFENDCLLTFINKIAIKLKLQIAASYHQKAYKCYEAEFCIETFGKKFTGFGRTRHEANLNGAILLIEYLMDSPENVSFIQKLLHKIQNQTHTPTAFSSDLHSFENTKKCQTLLLNRSILNRNPTKPDSSLEVDSKEIFQTSEKVKQNVDCLESLKCNLTRNNALRLKGPHTYSGGIIKNRNRSASINGRSDKQLISILKKCNQNISILAQYTVELQNQLKHVLQANEHISGILENEVQIQNLPSYIQCPISHEIMQDPVSTIDGHTYERKEIENWFTYCKKSPITGLELDNTKLVNNYGIRKSIEHYNLKNQMNQKILHTIKKIHLSVHKVIDKAPVFSPEKENIR